MYRKKKPFYIIYDQTFQRMKRRTNILFFCGYLSTIIICLIFSKSLLFIVMLIFLLMIIKRVVILPNFHHQIQIYPNSFIYIFKRNVYSLEYGSVAFIDQDVFELSDAFYYKNLSLLDEQMDILLTIDGRYFNYDDLVIFCQYIQDTNFSSRNNYYNRDNQFLSAVTDMDKWGLDK